MGNAEIPTPPTSSDSDPLAALRAKVRITTHDAKNAVGIVWLHLAMIERKMNDAADADAREALAGVKEETRQILKLLEALSEQAKS